MRATIRRSQIVDTRVTALKLWGYMMKTQRHSKSGSKAMSGKRSHVAEELEKFVRAFWLELPLAAANRILGKSDDQALSMAGWKAYDALISLSNETTNQLYQDRTVGALTGRAMETALRAQH